MDGYYSGCLFGFVGYSSGVGGILKFDLWDPRLGTQYMSRIHKFERIRTIISLNILRDLKI